MTAALLDSPTPHKELRAIFRTAYQKAYDAQRKAQTPGTAAAMLRARGYGWLLDGKDSPDPLPSEAKPFGASNKWSEPCQRSSIPPRS